MISLFLAPEAPHRAVQSDSVYANGEGDDRIYLLVDMEKKPPGSTGVKSELKQLMESVSYDGGKREVVRE